MAWPLRATTVATQDGRLDIGGRDRLDKRRAFLIAGPTASGKSALALTLADRCGGTVINADSMAVYRDLRILTGRPTVDEEAHAPHRLYGHVDAAEAYSVGHWLVDVAGEIAAARRAGRLPIVVGGTGLYFKALTRGLSDIPSVSGTTRARVRAEADGVAADRLHARLAACDPLTAARLKPSDPQRIVRALEVFTETGRPLASYQDDRRPPTIAEGGYTGVVIAPDRQTLRQAIDARFDGMMQEGALDEVAALAARRLDPALPAMRALGVPPLLDVLGGNTPLADAVARAKAQTRAYAKRQVTFARHQLPDFAWISLEDALSRDWAVLLES